MKHWIILTFLIITSSITFSQIDSSLTVNFKLKSDSTMSSKTRKSLLLEISINNMTNDTIDILTISCAHNSSLVKTKNKYLSPEPFAQCNRSIPVLLKLSPNELYEGLTFMGYYSNRKLPKEFEIGFVVNQINSDIDISKYRLADVENSINNCPVIIWKHVSVE